MSTELPRVADPARTASRVLAAAACGWAALLVLLSFVLPVVTVPSGTDGPQPRVSLVHDLGPAGLVPAVVAVAASAAVAGLLGGRGRPRPPWTGWAAVALADVVLLACLASAVLTHLAGLLTVPVGVLLVLAASVALARRGAL